MTLGKFPASKPQDKALVDYNKPLKKSQKTKKQEFFNFPFAYTS